jgi:hypothetical protein
MASLSLVKNESTACLPKQVSGLQSGLGCLLSHALLNVSGDDPVIGSLMISARVLHFCCTDVCVAHLTVIVGGLRHTAMQHLAKSSNLPSLTKLVSPLLKRRVRSHSHILAW